MSMWDEMLETLRTMSIWQLLFAFVACTGYALAQGRLVGARGKWAALGLAAVATFAFVVESERWVDGFMLIVVGIAGMGIFAAFVWTVSRALGMTAVAAPRTLDAQRSLPPQDPDSAPGATPPLAAPPRAAPSH